MLKQRRDTHIVVLEQFGDELRIERQIEDEVERIHFGGCGQSGDRYAVQLDLRPVAEEENSAFRVLEVLPQTLPEGSFSVDRPARLSRRRLYPIERVVRIEDVWLAQREIERKRLAASMDVQLVAARDRLGAALVVIELR